MLKSIGVKPANAFPSECFDNKQCPVVLLWHMCGDICVKTDLDLTFIARGAANRIWAKRGIKGAPLHGVQRRVRSWLYWVAWNWCEPDSENWTGYKSVLTVLVARSKLLIIGVGVPKHDCIRGCASTATARNACDDFLLETRFSAKPARACNDLLWRSGCSEQKITAPPFTAQHYDNCESRHDCQWVVQLEQQLGKTQDKQLKYRKAKLTWHVSEASRVRCLLFGQSALWSSRPSTTFCPMRLSQIVDRPWANHNTPPATCDS